MDHLLKWTLYISINLPGDIYICGPGYGCTLHYGKSKWQQRRTLSNYYYETHW